MAEEGRERSVRFGEARIKNNPLCQTKVRWTTTAAQRGPADDDASRC